MSFINDTGSNNSMLFSSNQVPSSNSCGGQCTSYQNGGGGYGFSGDQTIPGFRLPEVKSYLNVGINSDTNLGASKQYTPNIISGGKHRKGHRGRNRRHSMRKLRGGSNDIFYGFTGNDANVPAFRGSYPPMSLGNNASVNSVGGRRRMSRKLRYRGGSNYANYDSKNTFYGFNGENRDNISLFKGSYAPVNIGDNDMFSRNSVGGYKRRRTNSRSRKHKKNASKSKNNRRNKSSKTHRRKHKKNKMQKMIPMSMSMSMPMQMNNMNMGNSKKNMRSKLFKSLIGGRHPVVHNT